MVVEDVIGIEKRTERIAGAEERFECRSRIAVELVGEIVAAVGGAV